MRDLDKLTPIPERIARDVLVAAERPRGAAAANVVSTLRRTADDVERHAAAGDFTQILHDVSWGIANSNLDSLMRSERDVVYWTGALMGTEDES